MKRRFLMPLAGLVLLALFLLGQVVYLAREGEAAVVTTLGRLDRAITQAGPYLRWPWPIQRIYRFDGRIHCLETALQEVLTRDGKNVLVALYAGWRIADPIRFLERLGSMEQAETNLEGLLRNAKNAALGQYPFSSLVNPEPDNLRYHEIEAHILQAVRPEARERYGIEVAFIGLNRLGLPEAITEKVFDRMRAEREELAEKYRSQGEGEALKIRAEADARRDQLLAGAEADARRLRAEGDAEAAAYYRVFEQDPELALFLRKLEVLEKTLSHKATVVLGTDTEPFDLLQGSPTLPAGKP